MEKMSFEFLMFKKENWRSIIFDLYLKERKEMRSYTPPLHFTERKARRRYLYFFLSPSFTYCFLMPF